MIELRFVSDPGHAWLEVPSTLIKKLGISDNISKYSYKSRTGNAYLEEDCDAPLFFEAAQAAGIEIEIEEVYEEQTKIRRMNSYR